MALLPDTGDLALRYAAYIAELQEFFAVHNLRYGTPDDLVLFDHRLNVSETFAAELASMVRSFIFRERAAIPHADILAILALSSGGAHIESYAYDLQRPLEDLSGFLATITGAPLAEPQPLRTLPSDPDEPNRFVPAPLSDEPVVPAHQAFAAPQPRASLPFAEPSGSTNPFPTGVQADKFLAAAMLTAADLQRNRPAPPLESPNDGKRRLWIVGAIALPLLALAAFLLNRPPTPADAGPNPAATISAATPAPGLHPASPLTAPSSSLTPSLPLSPPSTHGIPDLLSSAAPTSTGALRSSTPLSASPSSPSRASGIDTPKPSTSAPIGPPPSPQPAPTQPGVTGTAPPSSATTPSPTPGAPSRPSTSTQVASVAAHQGLTGISSGIMSSHLLRSSQPRYPKMASLTRAEGTVILQAVISRNGRVISVHAIDGPHTLRKSAVNAVRTWRYRPYVAEGRPVDVATVISIDFKAPH